MAICSSVGHSDSGKERPLLDELPGLLETYRSYEETGTLPQKASPSGFIVADLKADNPNLRLDARYFNPLYFTTMNTLDTVATERGWKVVPLRSLLKENKESLTGGATPLGASYPDEGPKFIRVQNVRPNLLNWNPEEGPCIDTHTHKTLLKRSQLCEGDVVFTITGSYGIAAVVPPGFGEANINQHSVRIRVNDQVLPEYLSVFLNSELCRPQIDRAVTGSSRLALDYKAIRELKVLLPLDKKIQKHFASVVTQRLSEADTLRKQAENLESKLPHILDSAIPPIV